MLSIALLGRALAEDLQVTSNVSGATIYVDGVEAEMLTPATVYRVTPGLRTVRVVKGCFSGQAVVDVAAGKPTKVNIPAVESVAKLAAYSQPPGATILLDGAPYPGAPGVPVQVTCGSHKVEAQLKGYAPLVAEVEALGGDTTTVPLTLRKMGLGQIDMAVRPTRAEIRFDGRVVGTDTVMLPAVDEGLHMISAELDGRNTATAEVWVDAGDSLAYQFKLSRGSRPSQVVPYGDLSAAAVAEAARRRASGDLGVGGVTTVTPTVTRSASETTTSRTTSGTSTSTSGTSTSTSGTSTSTSGTSTSSTAAQKAAEDAADAAAAKVAAEAAADGQEAEKAEAQAAAEAAAKKKAAERAAAEKKAAEGSSSSGREENPTARRLGWVMVGAGALTGVGAVFAYDAAVQDLQAYDVKVEAARKSEERKKQLNALAEDWYTEEVIPSSRRYFLTVGATGVLLVGGVSTLTIAAFMDGGTTVTVAPGRLTLGWSF